MLCPLDQFVGRRWICFVSIIFSSSIIQHCWLNNLGPFGSVCWTTLDVLCLCNLVFQYHPSFLVEQSGTRWISLLDDVGCVLCLCNLVFQYHPTLLVEQSGTRWISLLDDVGCALFVQSCLPVSSNIVG